MTTQLKTCFLWMAISVWGILVGTGVFWLYQFGQTPSPDAVAPESWPTAVELARGAATPTLLVFIHPHCACSHASIRELERLTAKLGANLSTTVVFWHPEGLPPDWHQTSLWTSASAIPRVNVIDDVGGITTHRFGVATSGQALLYDSLGQLRFRGGITSARGHSGDNVGSDTILALSRSEPTALLNELQRCSVFGCEMTQSGNPAAPWIRTPRGGAGQ